MRNPRKERSNLCTSYTKQNTNSYDYWHSKLAHLGPKNVFKAIKDSKYRVSDTSREVMCEGCALGKSQSHPHRATGSSERYKLIYKPGERIEMDLQGPFLRSRWGNHYGAAIIDPVSEYIYYAPMPKKSSALKCIKKTISNLNARSGNKVRLLKSDGDGIFTSKEMEEYCVVSNIRHEYSSPGDHRQNGRPENLIKTISSHVRAVLVASGIPRHLWDEVACAFCFVRNNVRIWMNKKGSLRSAKELLEGHDVAFNIELFLPNGCLLAVHIPSLGKGPRTYHVKWHIVR